MKPIFLILLIIVMGVGGWFLVSQNNSIGVHIFTSQSFDLSKCENISIQKIQRECYLYEAIKSNKPEFCQNVLELGGSWDVDGVACFKAIAKNTEDISVCDKINDTVYKIQCEATVSKDASKCGGITENVTGWWEHQQNVCNVEVAVITENATVCENVVNGNTNSEFTKDACYRKVASKLFDRRLCDKISINGTGAFADADKKLCEAFVTGRIDKCDDLWVTYKEKCDGYFEQYNIFREKCKEKSTLCYLFRNSCIYHTSPYIVGCSFVSTAIAIDTSNLTFCEAIGPDCTQQMAYQTNNAELCKGESKCYSDIAVRTKNPNICNKIEKEYERDNCLKNIAVITKNVAICNNINTTWIRADCTEKLRK